MQAKFLLFATLALFTKQLTAEISAPLKYWTSQAPSLFQKDQNPLENPIFKEILSLPDPEEKIAYTLALIELHAAEDEDIYEMEDLDNALWIRVGMAERVPLYRKLYESLDEKQKINFAEKVTEKLFTLQSTSHFTVYLKEDLSDKDWISFFSEVVANHIVVDDDFILKLRGLPPGYLNPILQEKIFKETCGSLHMAQLLEERLSFSEISNEGLDEFFSYLSTLDEKDGSQVNFARIYKKSLESKHIDPKRIQRLENLVQSNEHDRAYYISLIYSDYKSTNSSQLEKKLKDLIEGLLTEEKLSPLLWIRALNIINEKPTLISRSQKEKIIAKLLRSSELEKESDGALIHLHLLGILLQSGSEFPGEIGPNGIFYKIFTHPKLKDKDFFLVYSFIEKAKRDIPLENGDSILAQSAFFALSKNTSDIGLVRAIQSYVKCPFALKGADYLFIQASKQLDLSHAENVSLLFSILNKYPLLKDLNEAKNFIKTRTPTHKLEHKTYIR